MPRVAEALVELFHAPLKDYPEHGRGTFRYPPPRRRKGVPLTPEELEGGALEVGPLAVGGGGPVTVNWPGFVRATGGARRSTVVSGPWPGLGLIRTVNMGLELGGGENGGVALLVSEDNSGAADSSTTVTPPSGVSVLEPLSVTAGMPTFTDEIAAIWPEFEPPLNRRPVALQDVRYIIRLPRFFLKVTCRAVIGDDTYARFIVTFLTNLTEEQVARYL